MDIDSWLLDLEEKSNNIGLSDVVLWPGSVARDMQPTIVSMYGKSDVGSDSDTRPAQIIKCLSKLDFDDNITILDICCGDGLVLRGIKQVFRDARCFGIDINKSGLSTLETLYAAGVHLYRVPMQTLFESRPPEMVDVTMMLNTYRGWGAAQLREQEMNLPNLTDNWLASHSQCSILTATQGQIDRLQQRHTVTIIGNGEQDSKMILVEWHE